MSRSRQLRSQCYQSSPGVAAPYISYMYASKAAEHSPRCHSALKDQEAWSRAARRRRAHASCRSTGCVPASACLGSPRQQRASNGLAPSATGWRHHYPANETTHHYPANSRSVQKGYRIRYYRTTEHGLTNFYLCPCNVFRLYLADTILPSCALMCAPSHFSVDT